VRMHRYRNPKEADGEPLSMGSSYADSLSFVSSSDEVGLGSLFITCDNI